MGNPSTADLSPRLAERLRDAPVATRTELSSELLSTPLVDAPSGARRDRDRAALMLCHLDDPSAVLRAALDHLVDVSGCARGDAGWLDPGDAVYRPQVVVAEGSDARLIAETSLPNHHPMLRATWVSSTPLSVERVVGDDRLTSLGPVFEDLGATAMLAGSVCHGGAGLALLCLDETATARTWSPDVVDRVSFFLTTWLAPILHAALVRLALRSHGALTAAEWRVVELLAAGHSYAQIAARLGRSVHTIDNQLRSARAKCGAHSGIELLARLGLSG